MDKRAARGRWSRGTKIIRPPPPLERCAASGRPSGQLATAMRAPDQRSLGDVVVAHALAPRLLIGA